MPSTRTLSLVLVGCVIIAIGFAFTLIATIAEAVALLALLGIAVQRSSQMSRLTSILLLAGIVLLPLGTALMIASASGGYSASGSGVMSHIGGALVNAAFAMMLVAAATHAARRIGAARRGRRPATR